ncbi:MAG: translation initiation factor IF-2 [Desulfotomaculaceae bacterium]|nr:translation initiation factor IF-2 [Desulfotomaculaceae bacterium]MDD4766004.1 translation initiation factor IF-2 [Desulfotomaculaceae bacterium]
MAKKRVHELAKELNIESKEIINKLNDMGTPVKSHMSTLEDSDIEELRKIYKKDEVKAKNADAARKLAGTGQSVPSATQQVEQGEKKKTLSEQKPVTGGEKQLKGEHKKEEKSVRSDSYRGHGTFDRVPSRPPDRRFQERQSGTAKSKSTPRSDQFFKPRHDSQQDRAQVGRTQQERSPRQEHQRQDRSAARPAADHRTQPGTGPDRPYDRPTGQRQGTPFRTGAGQAASGARPPQRGMGTPRPGSTQGARPKPTARQVRADASQGVKPRADQPLQIPRVDDKSRMPADKAKTAEKSKQPKPGFKKPGPRSRFEKRSSVADQAEARLRSNAHRKKGPSRVQEQVQKPSKPIEKKPVVLGESVTVQELALKIHKSPAELIKKLMQLGVLATINQEIDIDTATILAGEFGYEVEIKLPVDLEAVLMQEPEDSPELLQHRASVVTVMGHVDHGKTSLLDAIRKTNVIATEAGGITQHIGAYQIEHNGKKITFIDTPGHEAFTAMRARGAQVTDIAILVVAADDGVMPQTVEAINHAKDAKVPIIVAINKIDKPGANPDKVKQELTEHGLVSEEWGGDTICVNVSAANKQGIKELLEMILLVAEMGELKANANRPARGTVIEAELDKGRGPVASVLIQSGTLNVGDTVIAGAAIGRVRAMMDDKGRRIKKAGPSTPVEVIGFSEVPAAGDILIVAEHEKLARSIASRRQTRKRDEELRTTSKVSLEDLFKHIQEGQIKELGIIVKADVQGSAEALRQALERLNTGEVKVNIIHGGVGAIRETDVMFASASNAIIIGFNVRPDVNARKAAENEKVDIRLYRVIYDAIEDVKAAMSGLLEPEYREVMLGRAEIRKIFRASRIGTIAGCYVVEGKIERDAGARVVRDGIVVYEGKLESLKRFKDDVKEVLQGYECGLAMEKFNEIQEGDVVEAFNIETIKRQLS